MDLREKKTERNIRNAFLAIRTRKQLEKITVRELCESAEISKATFYLHYRDIYDLSEKLQLEVIDDIIQCVDDPKIFVDDPVTASHRLIEGFYARIGLISILFSGSQFARLPEQLEIELKEKIFREYPEAKDNVPINVRITYQLMGSFYAFYKYEKQFGFNNVMAAVDEITGLWGRPGGQETKEIENG